MRNNEDDNVSNNSNNQTFQEVVEARCLDAVFSAAVLRQQRRFSRRR